MFEAAFPRTTITLQCCDIYFLAVIVHPVWLINITFTQLHNIHRMSCGTACRKMLAAGCGARGCGYVTLLSSPRPGQMMRFICIVAPKMPTPPIPMLWNQAQTVSKPLSLHTVYDLCEHTCRYIYMHIHVYVHTQFVFFCYCMLVSNEFYIYCDRGLPSLKWKRGVDSFPTAPQGSLEQRSRLFALVARDRPVVCAEHCPNITDMFYWLIGSKILIAW